MSQRSLFGRKPIYFRPGRPSEQSIIMQDQRHGEITVKAESKINLDHGAHARTVIFIIIDRS